MITSIPARYRQYRSGFYRVPVEMEAVATSVSSEELSDNDAAQRGELSESQQLVLTFDENNEPFLRLLTEDDNNHAVPQTCKQQSAPSHSPNFNQINSPSPSHRELGPPSPLFSQQPSTPSPTSNFHYAVTQENSDAQPTQ